VGGGGDGDGCGGVCGVGWGVGGVIDEVTGCMVGWVGVWVARPAASRITDPSVVNAVEDSVNSCLCVNICRSP
jgi:hypothetical protein